MVLVFFFVVVFGKGFWIFLSECVSDSFCFFGVVYMFGIWISFWGFSNVGCIELLGVGVLMFMFSVIFSKVGLGFCLLGGEVFKDIFFSVDLYMYFFFIVLSGNKNKIF